MNLLLFVKNILNFVLILNILRQQKYLNKERSIVITKNSISEFYAWPLKNTSFNCLLQWFESIDVGSYWYGFIKFPGLIPNFIFGAFR
ncbi:hypothetical protein BpHYR1_051185 [Brachionus plicatilis]|uniref:Uncharacterized protein n=1 Tax=Brachionus plicatilis TaxID=10195 RepID=A0A3M7QRB4_BRAPC|nr:hypothetical protein BpHYR1_051185 [Brachionus plicatilis]